MEKETIIETGLDIGDGKDSTVEIDYINKDDDVLILDIRKIK